MARESLERARQSGRIGGTSGRPLIEHARSTASSSFSSAVSLDENSLPLTPLSVIVATCERHDGRPTMAGNRWKRDARSRQGDGDLGVCRRHRLVALRARASPGIPLTTHIGSSPSSPRPSSSSGHPKAATASAGTRRVVPGRGRWRPDAGATRPRLGAHSLPTPPARPAFSMYATRRSRNMPSRTGAPVVSARSARTAGALRQRRDASVLAPAQPAECRPDAVAAFG